jgi:hypothetical protein
MELPETAYNVFFEGYLTICPIVILFLFNGI